MKYLEMLSQRSTGIHMMSVDRLKLLYLHDEITLLIENVKKISLPRDVVVLSWVEAPVV